MHHQPTRLIVTYENMPLAMCERASLACIGHSTYANLVCAVYYECASLTSQLASKYESYPFIPITHYVSMYFGIQVGSLD